MPGNRTGAGNLLSSQFQAVRHSNQFRFTGHTGLARPSASASLARVRTSPPAHVTVIGPSASPRLRRAGPHRASTGPAPGRGRAPARAGPGLFAQTLTFHNSATGFPDCRQAIFNYGFRQAPAFQQARFINSWLFIRPDCWAGPGHSPGLRAGPGGFWASGLGVAGLTGALPAASSHLLRCRVAFVPPPGDIAIGQYSIAIPQILHIQAYVWLCYILPLRDAARRHTAAQAAGRF